MSNRITRCILWMAVAAAAAAPAASQKVVELPAKDRVLRDRPAPVFAVGTVEGESWEMFSGIRSVAFDREDNMYLLDGQNNRVVVFDPRGGFLREFGTQGGGPGEFQAPLAMDIASDGSVVVSDIGNRAFIVFTAEGEYVRNVPFDEDLGFPISMSADAAGGVVTRSMQGMRRGGPSAGAESFSPLQRHSLDDESGTSAQTLYRIPVQPPRVVDSGSAGAARRVIAMSMDPVFGPRPSFDVLPAGIALHYDTRYEILVLDPAGRHVLTIVRDHDPRKVTRNDQEEWKEQRADEIASGSGPTVVFGARRTGRTPSVTIGGRAPAGAPALSFDDTPFAEYMSVITSIRTDPQGRIWVQRRGEDGNVEGPIDLVSAAGRYIGTLPAQPAPDAVSGSGRAAWIVADDLGVERVEVRQLPRSWH